MLIAKRDNFQMTEPHSEGNKSEEEEVTAEHAISESRRIKRGGGTVA